MRQKRKRRSRPIQCTCTWFFWFSVLLSPLLSSFLLLPLVRPSSVLLLFPSPVLSSSHLSCSCCCFDFSKSSSFYSCFTIPLSFSFFLLLLYLVVLFVFLLSFCQRHLRFYMMSNGAIRTISSDSVSISHRQDNRSETEGLRNIDTNIPINTNT